MPALIPLIGVRFGRLLVTAEAGNNRHRQRMVKCTCDCGSTHEVAVCTLRTGGAKSCGCLYRDTRRTSATKHGHCAPENKKLYSAWKNMLGRCLKPSHHAYADYGGRGITVCERWRESFTNFLADVGKPERGLSLDRIDNNRGYEPGNVHWTSVVQQSRNRRNSVLTVDLVNEIRGRAEHGEGATSIAKRMGLTRENVRAVVQRKTWIDIP